MLSRLKRLIVPAWRLPLLVVILVGALKAALTSDLEQERAAFVLVSALLVGATFLLARRASQLSRQRRALDESLERETATSKVLEIMSRSASDLEALFRVILTSAIHLCDADWGTIDRPEAERLGLALQIGGPPGFGEWRRRTRDALEDRVLAEKRPIQIVDVQAEPLGQAPPPDWYRTALLVPMLREERVVGAIGLYRYDAAVKSTVLTLGGSGELAVGLGNIGGGLLGGLIDSPPNSRLQPTMRPKAVQPGNALRPFSDREIELVRTFAQQAVIAIENVRLLNEIQDKGTQLEAASRNKSEFLANMSHELRTPLNAIIGFSEVLEQRMFGELNERQADYLRDIAGSGHHLLTLVNEILDLSKVEAGRMELQPSEFDIGETIRGTLVLIRERAARHGIELAADTPDDLGTMVADERKVRQVVLNLLSNAVKFTPDGGRIGVSARRSDEEIRVSVRDTGIGIAREDQAKVFDEFQQVGRPSARSREGTGLGLTLAKRFVELHGGRIWLESEVGKGTTFTFAMPSRGSVGSDQGSRDPADPAPGPIAA